MPPTVMPRDGHQEQPGAGCDVVHLLQERGEPEHQPLAHEAGAELGGRSG